MPRLSGKLALITGGNSGIGLATAKAFVAEGARVAITGRDPVTLKAARQSLGPDVLALQSDAGDLSAIDALAATIRERFGALDILFANAGSGPILPLEQITEAIFDKVFAVNVKGPFFTVQKLLPLFRPGASIIFNSSIAARTGRPGLSAYAASKAALRALARNFSSEFAARGFRVNVISPGRIDTPIWDRGQTPEAARAMRKRVVENVPVGRMGTAEEIAQAAIFLASDESRYMLGSELTIDGGVTELLGPHRNRT